MLREWSKKCSWLWSNTTEPNCTTTALWIAALRFLSKQMPFPCSITLRWKMTDTFFFKCTISCFDLFGSNSDRQAYRCSFAILLGVGGSTILCFLGDLRFGFGETCKCWGNLERCLEQHQTSTFVYLNLWLERSSQEWNDHYKCTYLDSVVTAHNITSCIITWYTT